MPVINSCNLTNANISFARNCSPAINVTVPAIISTWYFPAVSRVILCILQLTLNIAMLSAFIIRKDLRTSFTVYIIFLLSSNVFYALCEHPLEIIRISYSAWWLPSGACSLYLYLLWVSCAVPMHTHVLITINRIWAIAFPHSYRQHHSSKVACLMCLGNVVYVHVVCLPLVMLDQLRYAVNAEKYGCSLNFDVSQVNDYASTVQFIVYDGPIVFVVLAYPFLYYKQTQRRKIGSSWSSGRPSVSHRRESTNPGDDEELGEVGQKKTQITKTITTGKEASRPFVVLTLLTISVFICWTPVMTFWTITCFVSLDSDMTVFRNFAVVLFALQPVLDPILFAVSLQSFRTIVVRGLSKLTKC
ncbi:5-hydroxytryptamine receptor 2A-like [Paramacrobiotus metropolitanus]|uniref:5-hydroxytryptamine receptor 2A-like n=1 Tax=Paramacrobiotus metropolitanus TaxID=2943436 RepID=UPI002445916C|nr:5-hydroxytryptamine receptor 2A-like [Paramacrobiotus metropolitanus]